MRKFNFVKRTLIATTVALVTNFTAQAQVTEQSTNSFTVKHSFVSKKSVSLAKHQFGHAGWWWTSEFTQSGKGHNMFFNGKGLHEKLPSGETITHLTKVKKGVWSGVLGKIRSEDAKGKMKVSIKEHHHSTKITMEYTVTSNLLASNKNWPSYMDNMLAAQMSSLKDSLNNR